MSDESEYLGKSSNFSTNSEYWGQLGIMGKSSNFSDWLEYWGSLRISRISLISRNIGDSLEYWGRIRKTRTIRKTRFFFLKEYTKRNNKTTKEHNNTKKKIKYPSRGLYRKISEIRENNKRTQLKQISKYYTIRYFRFRYLEKWRFGKCPRNSKRKRKQHLKTSILEMS